MLAAFGLALLPGDILLAPLGFTARAVANIVSMHTTRTAKRRQMAGANSRQPAPSQWPPSGATPIAAKANSRAGPQAHRNLAMHWEPPGLLGRPLGKGAVAPLQWYIYTTFYAQKKVAPSMNRMWWDGLNGISRALSSKGAVE